MWIFHTFIRLKEIYLENYTSKKLTRNLARKLRDVIWTIQIAIGQESIFRPLENLVYKSRILLQVHHLTAPLSAWT